MSDVFNRGDLSRRELLVSSALAAAAVSMPRPAWALSNSPALAQSPKGIVTSPHELATQAGLEFLRKGGNAIEAVIRTLSGVGQAAASPASVRSTRSIRACI